MSPADLHDLIVASLPDWQNRFSIWAIVFGLIFLAAGSGAVRCQPSPAKIRGDVLRALRAGKYDLPLMAPRTGWLMCALGIAMTVFPFVDVNWLTTN